MKTRVHAFTDDALGDHDAVGVAELIRTGAISVAEATEAALARAERAGALNAVAHLGFDPARPLPDGPLYGVPTFVKDNVDVRGMPTGHGTAAFTAQPAARDGRFARQFLSTGMAVLGKSRLPEFGFNASTEF